MIFEALIIDTNVVVSGLLTRNPEAPTARLLDGMLRADLGVPFLVSPDLLAEYLAVLTRPRIRARHGLTDGEIESLLEEIAAGAVPRDPAPAESRAPDLEDQHLFDLLEESRRAALVTGDRLLLEGESREALVLSPARALRLLDGE